MTNEEIDILLGTSVDRNSADFVLVKLAYGLVVFAVSLVEHNPEATYALSELIAVNISAPMDPNASTVMAGNETRQ